MLPDAAAAHSALYPLWIVNLLATAVVSVCVIRRAFHNVPADTEDAARIDGCGFWRLCWHVTLPLVLPALGFLGIFLLVAAADDAMAPLARGPSSAQLSPFHLPAGSLGLLMAASLLPATAVIAVILVARRYFSKGTGD